ncbi:MAG TPA: AbrB/MazE/SpoVT family DNA-binding domain-containing protein [Candidatus Thermoplasmatota archaeon]
MTHAESRVTEGQGASIPVVVRRELGIEPGDVLLWTLKKGKVEVSVRKARKPAFQDFEPFDFGFDTNATEEHDEVF